MYLIRWKKIRSQEHMKFDKDGRNKMQKKKKEKKSEVQDWCWSNGYYLH